jgi:hypothetical protein
MIRSNIINRSFSIGLVALQLSQTALAQWGAALPYSQNPLQKSSLIHPIYIFQDIHGHLEAQKSIAESLKKLAHPLKELRIGVEGAAGPFNFVPYLAFPDPAVTRQIGEEFLKENRIPAPVLDGLTDGHLKLEGIEVPELYRSNVQAYRDALLVQDRLKETWAQEEKELDRKKGKYFSQELKKLDDKISSYQKGALPLGAFLAELNRYAGTPFFAIETFLSAFSMEGALDIKAVESQRQRFLRDLIPKLSPQEMVWLKSWAEDASADESSTGRRFDFLIQLAQSKGIFLRCYPRLDNYVRYLKLAQSIQPDQLFTEIRALEEEATARLCGGGRTCLELIEESQNLYLRNKLIRFELTPEEWEELKTRNSTNPARQTVLSADLRPFEDFYRIAESRNQAMADIVLKEHLQAVVAGGFHTPGLTKILK